MKRYKVEMSSLLEMKENEGVVNLPGQEWVEVVSFEDAKSFLSHLRAENAEIKIKRSDAIAEASGYAELLREARELLEADEYIVGWHRFEACMKRIDAALGEK